MGVGIMPDGDQEDQAGISMPSVGKALEKASNTGPGKALLLPGAKALGDYFGWRINEMTERWRKQHEENLKAHAEKVRETDGDALQREPTEKQLNLINEWVERAQEVDPEDPEIAALWQSVLGAIYRKNVSAKEWLDVIKQLNENDARLLLRVQRHFEPQNARERAQAAKLEGLGILEGFEAARFVRYRLPLIFMLIFVPIAVIGYSALPLEELFVGRGALVLRPMLVIGTVMMATMMVMIMGLSYLQQMGRYTMTEMGLAIQHSALRYLGKGVIAAKSEAAQNGPTSGLDSGSDSGSRTSRSRRKPSGK